MNNNNPADEILKFWFEDIEPSCWFRKDPEFDRDLEHRFGDSLRQAKEGLMVNGTHVLITVLP